MKKTPRAARMLLDTVFIQAVLNARDKYHVAAKALLPRVKAAERVWVTEAVFLGNVGYSDTHKTHEQVVELTFDGLQLRCGQRPSSVIAKVQCLTCHGDGILNISTGQHRSA